MLDILSILLVIISLSVLVFDKVWMWRTRKKVTSRMAFAAHICEASNLNAIGVCRYVADIAELCQLSNKCISEWRWVLPAIIENDPSHAGVVLCLAFSATGAAMEYTLHINDDMVPWKEHWDHLCKHAIDNIPEKEVA